MTFVSYAQNFEDVLLWRALGDVAPGFYIDLGASHPDIDSTTRAFYDRGWSGINVEPVPELHRRLQAARPRDINLAQAVSDRAGRATLFVADGTGLSTVDAALADQHAGEGLRHRAVEVECVTLAEICRLHAPGDIHFLKIDVEGSERASLAGADFAAFRPWIVLVEATAPMRRTASHAEWEGLLLDAGYRFVWFDGLNRFYLAAEREAALGRHFVLPPNVFDDFIRAADSELTRRIGEAEAEGGAARAVNLELTGRLREAEDGFRRLQGDYMQRQADIASLLGSVAAAEARFEAEADWVQAIRGSTSWRVTGPLRGAIAAVRLLRGRGAPDAPPAPAEAVADAQRPARRAEPPDRLPAPAPLPPGRLRGAVHQFHSGSAVGDAITNAMLLTRNLLQGLGYRSEIYVEFLDPALAGTLRPLDELPTHDGYVLIVRHSMGYGAFTRIRALPAPKVLIYHNITPPHLLRPELREPARRGRAQLADWRGEVAAALADSDYNALELLRLGFEGARACTLLFDLAALRAGQPPPAAARASGPFTILFVGRIAAAKGQDALVAAFARFCAGFDGPARLVLLGRAEPDDPFVEALRTAIAAAGLGERVVLAGLVPDADRDRWYREADLYVSLSRHEGFGVPLVEAIAKGLPVLALAAGAVPYTLAGAPDALLADASPETVAAAMLAVARDPDGRAARAGRQARSLDRFGLERQLPRLLEALAAAGAAPPRDPDRRRVIADNLHFTVTGHVAGSYSLALVNRALVTALERAHPGRVRLVPVEGRETEDISGVAAPERGLLAPLVQRAAFASGPNIVISQHYPLLVPSDPGDLALAMFFWEESLVPGHMVAALNGMFRGVLAPSRFVAKALIDSGVSVPVHVVGYAPGLEGFFAIAGARRERPRRATFGFLHVSSAFPRKGVDVLLAAYAAAFREGDPVRLVIKSFANPHNDVATQIAALRAADPGLAEIVHIEDDLSADAMAALYRDADAMVLPTRGEGFNIPAAEAMAAGLPLLVTAGGGHADFCDADAATLIDYRFAAARSHLSSAGSVWMEPDPQALAAAMRDLAAAGADSGGGGGGGAAAARAAAVADRGAWAGRIAAAGLDILLAPPRLPIRIGWVSTWNVRCGIAEYSRNLLNALPLGPQVAGVTVLADRRSHASIAKRGLRVRPAWDTADPDSMADLAAAIAQEDYDIVMVQHQPGLIKWGALADLLTRAELRARPVVVTLHTTRHLLQVAAPERAAAVAGLAGAARILVHTIDDLNVLKSLGLIDNASLLPHGTLRPNRAQAARPVTPGAAPLVGCYGFFLPGKGIPELIAATALLRRSYPAVRLRLVNADYGSELSAIEIQACREAVRAAGLEDAVEFQTGFLSNDESLALLGECDVVTLPYQASRESSSAALRTALCAGVPVAVTPLALFDEAADAVARLPGFDAAALAQGLGALLADAPRRMAVQVAALRWLAERDCATVAARLQGLLLGLTASPR